MFAEVIAVVLAGAAIAAYFERKALKADVVLAEGRVASALKRVSAYVKTKEVRFRADIAAHVEKVIAEAKRLRAEGFSLRRLAEQLASAGVRNRDGGAFLPTQVWRLLRAKP